MKNLFQPVAPSANSFLPEDYIQKKNDTRANLLTLTLFAIVMGAVVGAFFVTNQRWERLRARQEMVNEAYVQEAKRIEQLKTLEAQRASMMEKAQITAALLEKVPRWALLAELTYRMPDEMWLDGLTLKSKRIDPVVVPTTAPAPKVKSLTDKAKGKAPEPEKPRIQPPQFEYTLTITGAAEKNTDIANYLTQLKNSPALDRVELQFIRDARQADKDVRRFEVTAVLRGGVEPATLAASVIDLKDKLLARRSGEGETTGTTTANAGGGE